MPEREYLVRAMASAEECIVIPDDSPSDCLGEPDVRVHTKQDDKYFRMPTLRERRQPHIEKSIQESYGKNAKYYRDEAGRVGVLVRPENWRDSPDWNPQLNLVSSSEESDPEEAGARAPVARSPAPDEGQLSKDIQDMKQVDEEYKQMKKLLESFQNPAKKPAKRPKTVVVVPDDEPSSGGPARKKRGK